MPIYSAYGLAIRSDIELPALLQIDSKDFDVDIRGGAIAHDAGGATKFRNWEAETGRYLGHFFAAGRILVTGGDTITYDRAADADDSQVVSIILGTGLGALLMQREILPIHSCCVLTDRGAVMVMGRSGAGKSTMLGGLLELGLPMIADDVTGLVLDDAGLPQAVPAFPSIRLWKDSLNKLGHSSEGLPRVRTDLAKYYLPAPNFHAKSEPVRAIVYLVSGNQAALEMAAIAPAHQVETLSRFIFRKNFLDGLELRRFAFNQVAKTVNSVTMMRLVRPADAVAPAELAAQMLGMIEKLEA